MSQGPWLTIAQAADYFAIPKKSLYSLASRKLLPSGAVLRLGRQIRINPTVIEAQTKIRK